MKEEKGILFDEFQPFFFPKNRKSHQRLKKIRKNLKKSYLALYEELVVAWEKLQCDEAQKGLNVLVQAIEEQNDWPPFDSHEDGEIGNITESPEQQFYPKPIEEEEHEEEDKEEFETHTKERGFDEDDAEITRSHLRDRVEIERLKGEVAKWKVEAKYLEEKIISLTEEQKEIDRIEDAETFKNKKQ